MAALLFKMFLPLHVHPAVFGQAADLPLHKLALLSSWCNVEAEEDARVYNGLPKWFKLMWPLPPGENTIWKKKLTFALLLKP